ncbi:MAG: TRAP transporter substrate-binding protein [Kiritimatiellae bacterium]|jgi:tripartite ATP-independent transporter DctP family solute receptor|nr:TRAP transporter substrate-binding protein [Kiritimatiellia bacterium]
MKKINDYVTKVCATNSLLCGTLPRLIMGALLLTIFGGCGSKAEKPKIVRVAYAPGPSELLHRAAQQFAEKVKADSGGKLVVRLYPSGQLGNERELIEGLKLGSVDMTVTGLAIIGWYAPEYGAFEVPFLWRDYDHVNLVWNGPIGMEVRKVMQKRAGARLMQPWFRGPRYLTTSSRKVLSPDDLKGLKLRVPELEVYIKAWKAFGANVTPIPFTDIFMALKLGVVEGQENPLATIYANHLQEVQKYIMETRHLISFYVPAFGPSLDKRFTEEERNLLIEALDSSTAWHNLEVERAESEYRQKLEADGAEFVALDAEPFRKLACERIPPQFEKVWKPGLYQRISESR